MWLVLTTFLLTTLGCFAILMGFVGARRNREDEVRTSAGSRPLVFGPLTQALAGVLPAREDTRKLYARFLRQAGHYHAQALSEYLALRNALVVGAALLSLTALVVLTEPGAAAMYQVGAAGLLATVLLFAVPRLVLEGMAKARTRRIEESLPDALDMISMCMAAGLPLQHAISRVSDEMQSSHPDLAFELRIVGRQTEAGSLNSAVQQLAKRLDVPEIHSVAAMVWQADQQGVGVAGAFQSFSDQVRLNRRQRAEEAGNKAAFKMLFPLVFCLAPAVYLVLLGPAVMDLREFFIRERQPGGALSISNQDLQQMIVEPETPGAGPQVRAPGVAPAPSQAPPTVPAP